MDLIIVSVQVPSLATAALLLLTSSSCIKANMVKSINAYGHTTLGKPDLVQVCIQELVQQRQQVERASSEQLFAQCFFLWCYCLFPPTAFAVGGSSFFISFLCLN